MIGGVVAIIFLNPACFEFIANASFVLIAFHLARFIFTMVKLF